MNQKRPFFNAWRISLVAIFCGSVLLFWRTLEGKPLWDDHHLLDGSGIGGGTVAGALEQPFLNAYFRPLTSLSYLLDRMLYGQDPFGYHQTNILLHALTSCLVSCLGLLLFQSRTVGVVSGVLFASLPTQVSPTAWIGGRTDLLSCLFISLYCIGLVSYAREKRQSYLWLATTAFALACFSKEQNLALLPLAPIAIVCLDKSEWVPAFQRIWPVLAAAFGFLLIWMLRAPPPGRVEVSPGEVAFRGVASAANYALALTALWRNALFTLTLEDYRNVAGVIGGTIAVLIGVRLLATGWRRGGAVALVCAAVLFSYLPVSNFVPLPAALVGPYRVAVVGIFFCLAIAALVSYVMSRQRGVGYAISVIFATFFCFRSVTTIPDWRDERSFFAAVLQSDPHSVRAAIGVASEDLDANDAAGTLSTTEQALQWVFDPDRQVNWHWYVESGGTPPIQSALRRIGNNFGGRIDAKQPLVSLLYLNAMARKVAGDSAGSLKVLLFADRVTPDDPDVVGSIGDALIDTDRTRAIGYYERAVALNQTTWQNLRRLALQRLKDKRFAEAEALARRAISISPGFTPLYMDLSDSLVGQGRYKEALDALTEANKHLVLDRAGLDKRIHRVEGMLNRGSG